MRARRAAEYTTILYASGRFASANIGILNSRPWQGLGWGRRKYLRQLDLADRGEASSHLGADCRQLVDQLVGQQQVDPGEA